MAYDYAKLNGRIIEKCGTQAVFAERMGLSERTISMKLNNKIAFKQPEIQKALDVLELTDNDIQVYFFTMKVQND
jgi:transcriptional regulator with XRE-family HTH domain